MSEQDIATLVVFGLTVLQAKAYVKLLSLGRSRPSRLSSASGLVRPEAYRVLHELSAKGLVQKNLGSPSTYSAIAPQEALALLTERHKAKLVELSRRRSKLVDSLSTLSQETDVSKTGLSLITGGANLILRTREMIARGRHDYVGIKSKFGLVRTVENGIADAIIKARKRKMRVRLISEIDTHNVKSANYISRNVEMRRSRDVLFYMDIVDSKEMVFGPAFPLTEEESRRLDSRELDLWTSNPNFVLGMHAMFDRLWDACPRYQ